MSKITNDGLTPVLVVAGHIGQFTPGGYLSTLCDTHYCGRLRTHNLPIVRVTTISSCFV